MSSLRAALDRLPVRAGAVPVAAPTLAQRGVDRISGWLSRCVSRRGFITRAAVVGTAVAADPFGYVLKPGTAYASVCGPSTSCASGWAVFCATINGGRNVCPPGAIAAGWWKADGASLCGGKARYIIDCNGTCRCSTPGSRSGFCSKSCQSCRCQCGPSGQCDRRRVCCNDFRYGQCNQQVRQVGAVHCRVVSCTPPWRFERCSTSTATDNATRDHSSQYLPHAYTAITRHYIALGENGSVLGNTVFAEMAVGGGTAQRYTAGRISRHPSIGTWETTGSVWTTYVSLGAEAGVLGFPVKPRYTLPDRVGSYQRFQRGRITDHPDHGTRWMGAEVHAVYQALGAEPGMLGYPRSSRVTPADGAGHYNRFEHGRITHHPSYGTRWMGAEVHAVYQAVGAESGALGYPVTNRVDLPDKQGHYNRFEHGRITHHPAHGTLWIGAALHAAYQRAGAEPGTLGYPLTSQTAVATGSTGAFARFERGRISSKAPASGGFWMGLVIATSYVEQYGGEAGELGFPISDEYEVANGRRRVDFEHGSLVATGATVQRQG